MKDNMKDIRFALVAEVDGMYFSLSKKSIHHHRITHLITYPTRIMARIARQRLDPKNCPEGKIFIEKTGTKK